jgi:hypothetical protein
MVARAYRGVAYHVAPNGIWWIPIHVLDPLFVKQAVALALLVRIPVTNQFGYLSSDYQCEMRKYFFRYDQLVKNGGIQTWNHWSQQWVETPGQQLWLSISYCPFNFDLSCF